MFILFILIFILIDLNVFLFCRAEEASRIQRDIVNETESEPVTPQDLLAIDSDFHIRNRYLSKIGAKVCSVLPIRFFRHMISRLF